MIKKKVIPNILLASTLGLSFATTVNANNVYASENTQKEEINQKQFSKKQLIAHGVDSKKAEKLVKKMEDGKKLDVDIYLENLENEKISLATQENTYFRKDFPDGSFIENTIEDITEEVKQEEVKQIASTKEIQTKSITQIGGTQENRTLKISVTKPWGTMSFKVQIYFPLIGYSKIKKAYDWKFLGQVYGENYKGIYRASETATADAVAIYKLQIQIVSTGVNYLAKTEFRIRDGKYWVEYSA